MLLACIGSYNLFGIPHFTLFLGLVHALVGHFEKLSGSFPMFRIIRNADADRDIDFSFIPLEGLRDGGADFLNNPLGVIGG
jgi:hypothetical protein